MRAIDLPRPVGFVLGGGGSLGAVQVRMLQALSEVAVRPDLVVGTSVGSLNGAVVAAAPRAAANRLLPPLLASTAIPGIFPSVTVDGRQLYDGGVGANVPVTQALAMGARSLVVLDTAFPGHLPSPPQTLAEVLLYTAMVTMRTQSALETPTAAARVPVVYLPGPEIHRVSPVEFDHTGMLIEGGHQAARTFLHDLNVTGPGLYGPASPSCQSVSA